MDCEGEKKIRFLYNATLLSFRIYFLPPWDLHNMRIPLDSPEHIKFLSHEFWFRVSLFASQIFEMTSRVWEESNDRVIVLRTYA